MATQKQLKALEKARAAKALKRKYGANKGSGFAGLGNIKSLKKDDVVDMFKDTGAIILGYAGGKIGGELVKKALVKDGDEKGIKSWIPTIIQLGGGFLVSAAGGKQKFVKVLGNGMMASGAVSAIETASKKTIMELVGIKKNDDDAGVDGLGRTIDDVDTVNFNPDLPGISGPLDIEDDDFEEGGVRGIKEEIERDLNRGTKQENVIDDDDDDDDDDDIDFV